MTGTAKWPDGPYILEVADEGTLKQSALGRPTYMFTLRIVGTDQEVLWWISSAPGASWLWRDLVDHWEDLPNVYGRRFIMNLRTDMTREGTPYILRVREPLCEVLQFAAQAAESTAVRDGLPPSLNDEAVVGSAHPTGRTDD